MKKILLSLSLLLGFGASAQIAYNGDFEANYGTVYAQFSGGTRTTAAACSGTYGGQLALSASNLATGVLIQTALIPQTSNGQSVSVEVSYKKAAGIVGNISIAYFVKDQGTGLWNITNVGALTPLGTAEMTTCSKLTATIPAGALQPNAEVGVGVWVTRSSGAGNVYVDDINFTQDTSVTTAPACTTFTAPVAGSTIDGGNAVFSWTSAPTAVNYKLTVGTTSGGSNLYNGTVAGLSTNVSLPTNSTIYAKVVPSNLNGDAAGCTEITFNTNATVGYCGPITSTTPTVTYPISSVSFACGGGSNTSSATVGSPAYEDFSAYQFNAVVGTTTVLSVVATGSGTNRFGMTVWIDWNNDGDFDDASEQYFTDPATYVGGTGATINLTGNILVPANTAIGSKRMRIKYNFSSSTTSLNPALASACSDMSNGQTEDYTIVVARPSAAPSCTTFISPVDAAVGVTPNPAILTWAPVCGASGYRVYIGTSSGGTTVANTSATVPSYSITLATNTVYYAKVVPFNSIGDATGCTEIMFTTGNLVYCTATATSTNEAFERIGRVQFADIDNTSNLTPSSRAAGYEDFTSITGTVQRGKSYPITVTVDNFDADQTSVWIDYNQDGIFADSEKTVLTVTGVATGTVLLPIDAKLGNTRMRVRTSYNDAPTACGNTAFGQVEDYTINIQEFLAVSNENKSAVSIYPNPFQDVLNISDVKGVKSVSVSDVSGRQVKSLKAASELNLSDLKTGLYIVTLHMEDGKAQSFKAIKK